MKETLDIKKNWIRESSFKQESVFFLERFISEEQYRFFHDECCNSSEDKIWIWSMSGGKLDIFRRFHDRREGKWIEYYVFQIELKSNSDRQRVLFDAITKVDIQKQIKTHTKLINVLFDCWLGIHEKNTIENESGVFICDEKGNLIDFQPRSENLINERTEQIEWPTKDMLETHRHCWAEVEYICKNLHVPNGVYSIGLEPDIYRSSLEFDKERSYCFQNCVITGQLTFPPSLRIIGPGSFVRCFIHSVTINPSIYGIGNYAFSACSIRNLRIEKDFTPPQEDITSLLPFSQYIKRTNFWLVGRQFRCIVENLYVRKEYPYKALFSRPIKIENVFYIDSAEGE